MSTEPNIFWPEFIILLAAALVGGVALTPYSFQLLKLSKKDKPLDVTMPRFLLLSLLQTAVLFAITIGVGLLAAHSIGLGAPYVEAIVADRGVPAFTPMLTFSITLGLLGGLFLLLMDLVFLPYLPKSLIDMARTTSLWQNFAASFYGGLNEEFLMRLFGLSAFAWLLSRIWHTPAGAPTDAVFWVANVVMAVIFGLGHLPATRALAGRITRLLLIRALLFNGVIGLACGWLFWRYGLEATVVAHFVADMVYHVGGTVVFRFNDRYRFRQVS